MINTLIRATYDGTNYSGFQIQANAPTIQGELEKALGVIYKQPLRVTGSGRTDSGVHARGQVINYMAPFRIPLDQLAHAINATLPPDIVIIEALEVPAEFHARFDARRKIYSYTVDLSLFPQVLRRLYSLHMPDPLDLGKMRTAASLFTGTHDFKAFQAAGSSVTETTRTMYRVELEEEPVEQLLRIYYEGSGFLFRMARLMTGTLIRVGKGSLTGSDLEAALVGLNPAAVGPPVPAHGLCLENVGYDPPR